MPLSDKDPAYWFGLAIDDERSAEILREAKGPPGITAYHYHQAAEKVLKGAILQGGSIFPFVHDLMRLYEILRSIQPSVNGIADSVEELQSLYSQLRYPREDKMTSSEMEKARNAHAMIKLKIDSISPFQG